MGRRRARALRGRVCRRGAVGRADAVGPARGGMGGLAMSIVTVAIVLVCMVLAVTITLAAASIRILREYERAVVFRLGRLLGEKGPGLILLIPAIDRMVRVDLRTVTLDIPPQNLITRDNVPAK